MTSLASQAAVLSRAAPKRKASFWRKREDFIVGVVAVGLFLLLWEVSVAQGWIKPLFVSAPSRIVKAFAAMVADGSIWRDLGVSGLEFALGYGLAVLVGISDPRQHDHRRAHHRP